MNNYALFIANELEESVILSMRGNKTTYYPMGNGEYIKGLKIIPIDIDILKKILINDIKYQDIYEWFKKAFDSKIEDPLWYQKEILEKI